MIECIILCALVTLVRVALAYRNPLSGIHNAHPVIQERVKSLPQYKAIEHRLQLPISKRVSKKIPALMVVAALLMGLVILAGADSFITATSFSFILWAAVKLYVVLILDCLWYANAKKARIHGTEDLDAQYKDYLFYLRSIPRSLVAGLLVAIMVGLIVLLVS